MKKIESYQFKLKDIEKIATIHQGHTDDLKIDTGTMRVWLSRLTIDDGMPYNNQVTVELLQNGSWITIEEYQAK